MNNSSIEHHDDDDDRPYLAPSIHYAIGSLLITTMSVGAFLNFLGLLTFAKNKHLRSPTNVFILSLILGDFLMATFATPLAMISSFNTYWYFGEVACKFEGFIVYFIGMANMYTLCAISLDRYVVIAKPLLTSKITHRVAVCCVSLCWFFGFFWAALPLIGWNHYQLEAAHTSCSVVWESDDIGDQSYIMAIFIFCLIVPICLMIFAYYNVFMTVLKFNGSRALNTNASHFWVEYDLDSGHVGNYSILHEGMYIYIMAVNMSYSSEPHGNLFFITTRQEEKFNSQEFPAVGHYIVAAVLGFCGIFGVVENISVFVIFAKNVMLQTPTNMFILSLALADFLMCILSIPLVVASSIATRWIFGRSGCVVEGFVVYFLGVTSLYTLCAISVDRYLIIVKPITSRRITHKVAMKYILLCWALGFFWAALPLLGWSSYELEGARTSCSINWTSKTINNLTYIFTIFITNFLLPLAVICITYYNIYMTIRSVSRNSVWDMNSRVARRNLRIEKKMARTIFLMVGVFLLAWSPYAIVSFWAAFGHAASIPVVVGTIPAILAKSSSIFNPLIYVATNKQFRMAFYEMIPCEGLKDKLLHGEDEKDDDESDDDGNENQSDRKTTTTQKITMVAPARNEPQEEVTQNEDMPPSPDAQGATGGVYTA